MTVWSDCKVCLAELSGSWPAETSKQSQVATGCRWQHHCATISCFPCKCNNSCDDCTNRCFTHCIPWQMVCSMPTCVS